MGNFAAVPARTPVSGQLHPSQHPSSGIHLGVKMSDNRQQRMTRRSAAGGAGRGRVKEAYVMSIFSPNQPGALSSLKLTWSL